MAFWAHPLFEQLTRDPGNLGVVARFAREGGSDHTVADGWHVVADALGWRAPWITGNVPRNLFTGEVVLGVGLRSRSGSFCSPGRRPLPPRPASGARCVAT